MKAGRQAKIIELIGKYNISTQEELMQRLSEEGYEVTQATVSRDIRQLHLIKTVVEGGKICYKPPGPHTGFSPVYLNILRNGYVSLDTAGNILVLKTVTGSAMGVATAIDALDYKEVVGCIAGDDTIMVVIKTPDACQLVAKRIRKLMDGNY